MASSMPQWARMASPMPRRLNNGFTDAENGREWPRKCQKSRKRPINAAIIAYNGESPRRNLQTHSDGPSEATQQKETTKLRGRTRRTNIGGEIIEEEDMLKYQNL
jgi:hypothetical protein